MHAWKHHEGAFGASPAWVAFDEERLVGVRVFMRWEFERDGRVLRAVRAVDTATHPDARGRGVFTRLTMHAVDALRDDGVDFVFNTPNDQSRPGYLKMGWQLVGRLPIAARPGAAAGLVRMARARVPAQRWSEASTAGAAAGDVVAEEAALDALLASVAPSAPGSLRTRRDVAFLRWRYGAPHLAYRALVARRGPEHGVAFFRERRRGPAREAVVCDVIVPAGAGGTARALASDVARATRADYTIAMVAGAAWSRAGFVPLPRQGPVLTWRSVATGEVAAPSRDRWHLGLGDIELF
jgi:GNAT superfamily N-acetyltransferase